MLDKLYNIPLPVSSAFLQCSQGDLLSEEPGSSTQSLPALHGFVRGLTWKTKPNPNTSNIKAPNSDTRFGCL